MFKLKSSLVTAIAMSHSLVAGKSTHKYSHPNDKAWSKTKNKKKGK